MKSNRKSLSYYMSLDYDLRIDKLEDEGEAHYKAYALELDEGAVYGVGVTKQEAMASFEETKRSMFEIYVEEDMPIPQPERVPIGLPSGKFLIRTQPLTHRRLVNLAKRNGQSLNAFVNTVLERYVTATSVYESFERVFVTTIGREMETMTALWTPRTTDIPVEPHPRVEDNSYAEVA